MTLSKRAKVLLAGTVVLILTLICLGFVTAPASAEEEDAFILQKSAVNFVYSAEFAPNEQGVGFVFGVNEQTGDFLSATVDAKGKVALSSKDEVLKWAQCEPSGSIVLTLVVNEGIVKIFVGDSNIAVLVHTLDNYVGGDVGVTKAGEASNGRFASTDVPDGDFFCNGYSVLKVVNVTDGHCKLTASQYAVEKSVLTVSREYLKTLENDTAYTFRVVTSFTDFDFVVTTDFNAVSARAVLDKYYRGSDVTVELASSATVSKLQIDDKDVKFTQTGNRVVVASAEADKLSAGKHTVKLYTNLGRPEAEINISDAVETLTELQAKATHVFFWVDIAIFGALILAYVAFTVVKKVKKH